MKAKIVKMQSQFQRHLIHKILSFEPSTCCLLLVTAIVCFFAVVSLQGIIGFDPFVPRRLILNGIIVVLLGAVTQGLAIKELGGPLLGAQSGFAAGSTVILGFDLMFERIKQGVQCICSALILAIVAYFIAPRRPHQLTGQVEWLQHVALWTTFAFFSGAFLSSALVTGLGHFGEISVLTLHIGAWEDHPIPRWEPRYCELHLRSPLCIKHNYTEDLFFLCPILLLGAAVWGREAVKIYTLALVAQQRDSHVAETRVLSTAFGAEVINEIRTSRLLKGHSCLTKAEREASGSDSAFTYGEIAPAGIQVLMELPDLMFQDAEKIVDLGSGIGKTCFQMFLAPSVRRRQVVGIESIRSRHNLAEAAAETLSRCFFSRFSINIHKKSEKIEILEHSKGCRLTLLHADAARESAQHLREANLCFLHVCLGPEHFETWGKMLQNLPPGARIVSYTYLPEGILSPHSSGNHGSSDPHYKRESTQSASDPQSPAAESSGLQTLRNRGKEQASKLAAGTARLKGDEPRGDRGLKGKCADKGKALVLLGQTQPLLTSWSREYGHRFIIYQVADP